MKWNGTKAEGSVYQSLLIAPQRSRRASRAREKETERDDVLDRFCASLVLAPEGTRQLIHLVRIIRPYRRCEDEHDALSATHTCNVSAERLITGILEINRCTERDINTTGGPTLQVTPRL